MKYKFIEAFDCPDAWRQLITAIRKEGDYFEVKIGSECTLTQKLGVTVRIRRPEHRPLVDDKCISTNDNKAGLYALEYLWIDNKQEDEDYTYGARINFEKQLDDAIHKVAYEPCTRQITIPIRHPSDKDLENPPCLTVLDFDVVGGYVNLIGYFRSWDAFAGFPENIAGLQMFNEAFVASVNEIMIANGEPDNHLLKSGELIFSSKNAHLYKRQFEMVDRLIDPSDSSLRFKREEIGES